MIAIDGPAGSGKSTVARAVAERLGLEYLDTGAMYRAVAFAVLRTGGDPTDAGFAAAMARHIKIEMQAGAVMVDGFDATIEIRGPAVTGAVSAVAANPGVRAELVARQRAWVGERGGGVLEGRDIGTVVFPDAELKVYLTAELDERARRRAREAVDLDYRKVEIGLVQRDRIDSTRQTDPLAVADDAVKIDTTGLTIAAVVDAVVELL